MLSVHILQAKLGFKHAGVGVAFRRLAEVELAGKADLSADNALHWAKKAVEIAASARMAAAYDAIADEGWLSGECCTLDRGGWRGAEWSDQKYCDVFK